MLSTGEAKEAEREKRGAEPLRRERGWAPEEGGQRVLEGLQRLGLVLGLGLGTG